MRKVPNLLEMIEIMRRINLVAVPGLVLASLLLFASPVYAEATTSTMTFHSATVTFPGVSNPCSGVGGTVTVTFNGVMTMTTDPQGGVHATALSAGTFIFVQVNGVTYTGHFDMLFGGNVVVSSGTFEFTSTFSARATGSDGSILQFRAVAHITVNPDGTATVSFMSFSCF